MVTDEVAEQPADVDALEVGTTGRVHGGVAPTTRRGSEQRVVGDVGPVLSSLDGRSRGGPRSTRHGTTAARRGRWPGRGREGPRGGVARRRGPSVAASTSAPRRRSVRTRRSSRSRSQVRVVTRSTPSPAASSTSASSSAAATRIRWSARRSGPLGPGLVLEVGHDEERLTGQRIALGSHAPAPWRIRNRPSPRACATRSG